MDHSQRAPQLPLLERKEVGTSDRGNGSGSGSGHWQCDAMQHGAVRRSGPPAVQRSALRASLLLHRALAM